MSDAEKISRTTARLPTTLHLRAKHYAEDQGTTLELFIGGLVGNYFAALDRGENPQAINGFTSEKKSDNVTSTDEEGRHTKAQGDLNEILASGDVGAMDAITKNLDAFVRLVRLEKGKHRPGSDRKGKESGGPGGQHQKPKRSAG